MKTLLLVVDKVEHMCDILLIFVNTLNPDVGSSLLELRQEGYPMLLSPPIARRYMALESPPGIGKKSQCTRRT